jgi:hypothetical protein
MTMFWNKSLEDRLIDAEQNDEKEIAILQIKAESNRERYGEILAQCLRRQAMIDMRHRVDVQHTDLETAFFDSLQSAQDADTQRLRELTEPLRAIEALHGAISARRSAISSAVWSWLGGIAAQFAETHPFHQTVLEFRKQLDGADSMQALLDLSLPFVKRFENDPSVRCGLFRFEIVGAQALGESTPALVQG